MSLRLRPLRVGSPLRMQRVLAQNDEVSGFCGITSAHAESTLGHLYTAHHAGDHLCACREYEAKLSSVMSGVGSPLRMQRVQ